MKIFLVLLFLSFSVQARVQTTFALGKILVCPAGTVKISGVCQAANVTCNNITYGSGAKECAPISQYNKAYIQTNELLGFASSDQAFTFSERYYCPSLSGLLLQVAGSVFRYAFFDNVNTPSSGWRISSNTANMLFYAIQSSGVIKKVVSLYTNNVLVTGNDTNSNNNDSLSGTCTVIP